MILGHSVQKDVSWEWNGHWVSLGENVWRFSLQNPDKQPCSSSGLGAGAADLLLPLYSPGFCNFSSLALSLSQNFNHQGALSLYDCLHLPPFQFLFKLFGLRFWFDWLWANTPLDWICRCPSLFCYDNVSYNSRSNDGVCHADELFMLFKAHQVPITMVRNETDKRVRNLRSKSRQFNSFR